MADIKSNIQRIACNAVFIVVAEKSAYSPDLIKRALEGRGFKVAVPAGGDSGGCMVVELDITETVKKD